MTWMGVVVPSVGELTLNAKLQISQINIDYDPPVPRQYWGRKITIRVKDMTGKAITTANGWVVSNQKPGVHANDVGEIVIGDLPSWGASVVISANGYQPRQFDLTNPNRKGAILEAVLGTGE